MPAFAYLLIAIGVIVWFYPFVPAHRGTSAASVVNSRSRWGVLLQFLAFSLLWQRHFWERPLPIWRTAVSLILFALAALLSWTSSRALAGQLRVDAALGADHRLVRSGHTRWCETRFTLPCCWCCAPAPSSLPDGNCLPLRCCCSFSGPKSG